MTNFLSNQKWSEATTQASPQNRRVAAAVFFLAVSGSSGWLREREDVLYAKDVIKEIEKESKKSDSDSESENP